MRPFRYLFTALFLFLFFGLFAQTNLQVSVVATGFSTGHGADIIITNPGSEMVSYTIPAGEIPGKEGEQGFGRTETISVDVPGNSTITVALDDLYCLDDGLKTPTPGSPLPTPDEWNPNSPVVTRITEIETVATDYIQFYGNPTPITTPDLITIVTQLEVWLDGSTITPDDLCVKLTESFEFQSGSPVSTLSPDDLHRFEYTTLQVIDITENVGKKLGLPQFTPATLPPSARDITPAGTPTHPEVAQTVKVTGTGRTTGHIADLSITNPLDHAVTVQIGTGDYYIMINDGQSQVAPQIPPFVLQPGETRVIQIDDGLCADISEMVLENGSEYPGPTEWVSLPDPSGTIPGDGDPNYVYIPTASSMPLTEVVSLLTSLAPGTPASGTPCIDGSLYDQPLIPGTTTPIPAEFHPDEYPGVGVTLVLNHYSNVVESYQVLKDEGNINTVMSGNPDQEKITVSQWALQRYDRSLEGKHIEEDHFISVSLDEIEQNTGKEFSEFTSPQQDQLTEGLDGVWDAFSGVGAHTKDVEPGMDVPEPTPPEKEPYRGFGPESLKPQEGAGEYRTEPTEPTLINNDNCACGEVSFTGEVLIGEGAGQQSENLNFNSGMVQVAPNRRATQGVLTASNTARPGQPVVFEINRLITGCSDCNVGGTRREACVANGLQITAQYGEVKRANGNDNTVVGSRAVAVNNRQIQVNMLDVDSMGIMVNVLYRCENPNCGTANCNERFLLKVKKAAGQAPGGQADDGDDEDEQEDDEKTCKCEDPQIQGTVIVQNGRSRDEENFTTENNTYTYRGTIARGTRARFSVTGINEPYCTGCEGTCETKTIKMKRERGSWRTIYRKARNGRETTRDFNLGITMSSDSFDLKILVDYDCESEQDDCNECDCQKIYTIRFRNN